MEFRSCTQPWFELQLMYDQVTRFCCYHDNIELDGLDISEIWNSAPFQKVRREIASGDPTGTRCNNCGFVKYVETPSFLEIPNWVSGARLKNWKRALEHFKDGTAEIDSYPIKYYLQFGLACNLRCRMCDHPTRFMGGENMLLNPLSLLDKAEFLKYGSSLHVIGGEPFLIPTAVEFLDKIAKRPDVVEIEVDFYTNAFLLHRFLEKLKPLQRVILTVSLDSFGESYERIRQRSNWERVSRNLLEFKEFALKNDRPEWQIFIACVIMKSGIIELPKLVQWCVENDLPMHFVPVDNQTDVARHEENIFVKPELLDEVPGWRRSMADAIDTMQSHQRHRTARLLEHLRDDLAQNYASHKLMSWKNDAGLNPRMPI